MSAPKSKGFFAIITRVKLFSLLLLAGMITIALWVEDSYCLFQNNTGYLADYALSGEPVEIGHGAKQSSGLAFDPLLNQLYVIANAPPEIRILTPEGKYIRTVTLTGFSDTEAITYTGNETFAVVSERTGTISWFELGRNAQTIEFDPAKSITLTSRPFGNTGLEGLTFVNETGQLFAAKERNPKAIYAIDFPVEDIEHPHVTAPWNAKNISWWSPRSFSGIHYQPEARHLFILSRRSRCIIEATLAGEKKGEFSLKAGSAKLQQAIGKAEGIVISPDGTLYICNEFDRLYIFKKKNG